MAQLSEDTQTIFPSRRRPNNNDLGFDFGDLALTGVNPLLGIGAKLGGGLLSLLGGKSGREKDRGRLFNFLEQLKRRPAIDPQSAKQFIPQIETSLTPLLNRLGRSRAGRVGTASGVGVGETLRQAQGQFGSQLLDIMRRIQEINARRPLDIARTQARLV